MPARKAAAHHVILCFNACFYLMAPLLLGQAGDATVLRPSTPRRLPAAYPRKSCC